MHTHMHIYGYIFIHLYIYAQKLCNQIDMSFKLSSITYKLQDLNQVIEPLSASFFKMKVTEINSVRVK